jgi:hypothetical protein
MDCDPVIVGLKGVGILQNSTLQNRVAVMYTSILRREKQSLARSHCTQGQF